jgi:hypothetical protein
MNDTLKAIPIIFYLKGSTKKLSAHLSASEFDCKCNQYGCKRTLVVGITIVDYENTRIEFGKPLTIRSGYRCYNHNYDTGGVGDSKHKYGLAIDIAPSNVADLDELEKIAEKYFDVVIKYKDFLHCHNKDGLNE